MLKSVRAVWHLVAGFVCLFLGAALLVLPGPGIPLLVVGLILLARELEWARRPARRLKAYARLAKRRALRPSLS
jgi:putative effector of murein hydrolase LrgA (UPF0299 family)